MGLRIVTLNLGGLGRVGFVFLSPARPLHSLDAIRVIAWPRFGHAEFRSRSHDAVIRVYDEAGNVIQTYQHTGDFKLVVTQKNVCDYGVSTPTLKRTLL